MNSENNGQVGSTTSSITRPAKLRSVKKEARPKHALSTLTDQGLHVRKRRLERRQPVSASLESKAQATSRSPHVNPKGLKRPKRESRRSKSSAAQTPLSDNEYDAEEEDLSPPSQVETAEEHTDCGGRSRRGLESTSPPPNERAQKRPRLEHSQTQNDQNHSDADSDVIFIGSKPPPSNSHLPPPSTTPGVGVAETRFKQELRPDDQPLSQNLSDQEREAPSADLGDSTRFDSSTQQPLTAFLTLHERTSPNERSLQNQQEERQEVPVREGTRSDPSDDFWLDMPPRPPAGLSHHPPPPQPLNDFWDPPNVAQTTAPLPTFAPFHELCQISQKSKTKTKIKRNKPKPKPAPLHPRSTFSSLPPNLQKSLLSGFKIKLASSSRVLKIKTASGPSREKRVVPLYPQRVYVRKRADRDSWIHRPQDIPCSPPSLLVLYLSSFKHIPFKFTFFVHKMLSHKILCPTIDFNFFRDIVEMHNSTGTGQFQEDGATKMLQILIDQKTRDSSWVAQKMFEIEKECESGGKMVEKLVVARKKYFWRAVKELTANQAIPSPNEDLDCIPQYCVTECTNGHPLLFGPYSKKPNRVTRQYGDHKLLTVSFELIGVKSRKDFLVLYSGVLCDLGMALCGRTYRLLSAPPSQISPHKASCQFFCVGDSPTFEPHQPTQGEWATLQAAQKFIGDRDNARTMFEFEARGGMSYSSTTSTITVHSPQMQEEPDITRNGYNFTDGCGKISPDLATQVAMAMHSTTRGREGGANATVFQVRIAQYKGMLVVDHSLHSMIVFRKSMSKFAITEHVAAQRSLEVLHTNKQRVGCASLNRQIIMLLSALAPPSEAETNAIDDYLLSFLQEHLNALCLGRKSHQKSPESLLDKEAVPIRGQSISLSTGHLESGDTLESDFVPGAFVSFSGLYKKCRFTVPDSWVLFGVASEAPELQEGQVFVQVNGKVKVGKAIVTKNPCIHPGDIRLLEAVDIPSLHHLDNVVVFSVYGERPPSNAISGSDLDGDEYFVSTNEHFTSIRPHKPASYDSPPKAPPMPPLSLQQHTQKVAEHIANKIFDSKLGALYNSHMSFADRHGVGSQQALDIACVLARLIDADKTGEIVDTDKRMFAKEFPHFVFNSGPKYHSSRILGKLHDRICAAMDECGISHEEVFGGDEEREERFKWKLSGGQQSAKWSDLWKQQEQERPKKTVGKRKRVAT